ncbi:helix-turn-helix domain-containing protein [Niallia sp. MER 6]|uniref:helix-turn-helix domain-containing protein n=1 Tax=Niallia sp. MER 6 TaxID=2939567 RepID=UPI00203EE94C|nr:helix-turn-helix transcriptional regulator [Niallia sp. MER 6]MCM3029818.1 helix-turn-helix domain-containing protein [Niallia sp. MER 6]
MINKRTGELIRKIRKEHKVSMIDLASALQTTQPRLSRIEAGEQDISIRFIEQFCNYFNIPLHEFFKQLNDMSDEQNLIDQQLIQSIHLLTEKQKKNLFAFLSALREEY